MPGPHHIYVALGSNLGDSHRILNEALGRLAELSRYPALKSSLWQTSPVDCPPDSPSFVNAAIGLEPGIGETPESFLTKLQTIEQDFGRRPKKLPNEPRPLDLDLIAWGEAVRSGPGLIIPHPRAHLRRFVLAPLNEIAPDLILPLQTKTVRQLLAELTTDERVVKVGGQCERENSPQR